MPDVERLRGLIDWLRNESEERMKEAIWRKGEAKSMRDSTPAELRAAKKLAENMTGRKLTVSATKESADTSARMFESIAGKLEVKSFQLGIWADTVESILNSPEPPAGTEAIPDTPSDEGTVEAAGANG